MYRRSITKKGRWRLKKWYFGSDRLLLLATLHEMCAAKDPYGGSLALYYEGLLMVLLLQGQKYVVEG